MKIIKGLNPIICCITILIVSSCSNKIFLQRKYTKGHYFARKTSIDQNQKAIAKKTYDVNVSDNPITIINQPKLSNQKVKQQNSTIAFTKKTQIEKLKEHKVSITAHDNLGLVVKTKTNFSKHENHRKRADWSNAAMSWSYANLAGAILFIPFFIFLVSSSSTLTFSAFLFSLLFILIGGALSIKSITLGAEAMKGEGGFFSRLFGLYGLITGVFAFIFAIFIFGILITLI